MHLIEFVVVGKTKLGRSEIKNIIQKYGRKLRTDIHSKLMACISTEKEIEKMDYKMKDLKHYGIQVVTEDFLENIPKGNVIEYIKANSICDWGTDVSPF